MPCRRRRRCRRRHCSATRAAPRPTSRRRVAAEPRGDHGPTRGHDPLRAATGDRGGHRRRRGDRCRSGRLRCWGDPHTRHCCCAPESTRPVSARASSDHVGRVVELQLRSIDDDAAAHRLVTGAVLRRGVIEVVPMNHLGPRRPGQAALLVGLLANQRRGTVRLSAERPDDPDRSAASTSVSSGMPTPCASPPGSRWSKSCSPPHRSPMSSATRRSPTASAATPTRPRRARWARWSTSTGAVIGYDDLFVADASVLPTTPPSGTYVPVLLLAERLAESGWPRLTLRQTLVVSACTTSALIGPLHRSGQGEQFGHALLEQIGHQPDIGDEVTIADEAEVEIAVVALHGDVEADAVGDRRHGVEVLRAWRPRRTAESSVRARWRSPG